MKAGAASAGWRGWAGLVLSPLAWATHHEVGAYLDFARCQSANTPVEAIVGLAALAVIGLGAALSYSAWRVAGGAMAHRESMMARFAPALSLLAAGLFAVAVAFQVLAALMLPGCFR